MAATQDEILELLTNSGIVSDFESKRVKEIVDRGERIDQALLRLGLISDEERAELVELIYGIPFVDLSKYLCDLEAAKLIPEEVARRCKVIPLFIDGEEITLAVAEPESEQEVKSNLMPVVKKPLRLVVADKNQIEEMLPRYYQSAKVVEEAIEQVARESRNLIPGTSMEAVEEALQEVDLSQELTREASVAALFQAVLINAVKSGATHIHFQPSKSVLRVKMRVKGKLAKAMDLPKNVVEPLYQRIRRMASLEERKLTCGSLRTSVRGRELDLKVSFMPTEKGERVVIWGFEEETPSMVFKTLGLTADESFKLWELINRPFGFVFIGGNESGAKLALNAILIALNRPDTSLTLFLAPPDVEIGLPEVERIDYPLNGTSLLELIKFIPTQDADVIAVWGAYEVKEISQLMQLALNGKLVFLAHPGKSGLRFIEEAIRSKLDKNLISLSLTGTVAYYILKRLCLDCRKETDPSTVSEILRSIPVESDDWFSEVQSAGKPRVYRVAGCPRCQKGHIGSLSMIEIIQATPRLKRCIIEAQNAYETSVVLEGGGAKTLISLLKEKLLSGKLDVDQALEIFDFGRRSESSDS